MVDFDERRANGALGTLQRLISYAEDQANPDPQQAACALDAARHVAQRLADYALDLAIGRSTISGEHLWED